MGRGGAFSCWTVRHTSRCGGGAGTTTRIFFFFFFFGGRFGRSERIGRCAWRITTTTTVAAAAKKPNPTVGMILKAGRKMSRSGGRTEEEGHKGMNSGAGRPGWNRRIWHTGILYNIVPSLLQPPILRNKNKNQMLCSI